MKSIKEDLAIAAKLGHELHTYVMDSTNNVGHGLMAGIFNVCLLAKSAPIEVTEEHVITLLHDAFKLVEEAVADEATSREAAKYGIQ